MKEDYDKMQLCGAAENKANITVHSSWFVVKTKKADLKKQSQFAGEQIGVISYMKRIYGILMACLALKNKANLATGE